jgi:hypothetical protein
MKDPKKIIQLFLTLFALLSLTTLSFGQVPTVGANTNDPQQIEVSDQKPGSLLVYPYYTSNSQTKADTRITLSNLGAGNIGVHLFFLRGSDCQQSDQFVCLTKGASIAFKMSELDPEVTGYIVAVAVDANGQAVSWNALIGNAFVNAGNIVGNYGAEAFAAIDRAPGFLMNGFDGAAGTQTLFLDGNDGGYDRGADQFAVEIQSPSDATGQTIVHASLAGDISAAGVTAVAQRGTGLVVRGDEKQGSFVRFISGNCQAINVINANAPRVPTGLGVFLPRGSIGTMVYNTNVASVGLLLTPRTNTWSGIRTLHKTRTVDSTLTIPVFMPVC